MYYKQLTNLSDTIDKI